MKKIILALLAVCLLTGCHRAKKSVQEQTSNEAASMETFSDSYYKIVNFGDSELREDFYLDYGATSDFQNIGRGLQMLSAQYFSTSSYYMGEGRYLGLEEKQQLVKRAEDKSKYPYTLQPEKGSSVEGVSEPIMVSNVQEQDYYVKDGSNYTLKGASFAIILDPTNSDGSALESDMSDSTLRSYGEQCVKQFYKFINEYESFQDNLKDLPIVIAIYKATDTSTSTVGGDYILKSYCDGGVGSAEKVNYETVLFSSDRAQEVDKATYTNFVEIKASLKNASTEAAGLVGEAHYIDGDIQSMVMNANLNIKTYTELLYLTSVLADSINSKFTYDFDCKVLVNSQDKLQAIIVKNKGEKAESHILY